MWSQGACTVVQIRLVVPSGVVGYPVWTRHPSTSGPSSGSSSRTCSGSSNSGSSEGTAPLLQRTRQSPPPSGQRQSFQPEGRPAHRSACTARSSLCTAGRARGRADAGLIRRSGRTPQRPHDRSRTGSRSPAPRQIAAPPSPDQSATDDDHVRGAIRDLHQTTWKPVPTVSHNSADSPFRTWSTPAITG
jgi:hypothetical protein